MNDKSAINIIINTSQCSQTKQFICQDLHMQYDK